MKRIRLIIVEDNRLLREGLSAMLSGQSDITVIAALRNGEALLRTMRKRVDVVLLDLVLRSRNSLGLVQSIKRKNPEVRIVVMDLAPIQPALVDYVMAGVDGFVLKDATFAEFLHAIRQVARGTRVMPAMLTSSLLSQIADHVTRNGKGNPFKSVRMTSREREVVELIAEGLSNKQIAAQLSLAVDTVKSHVHNILEKLSLHTRLEIASYRHLGGPFPHAPRDKDASDE
ncbi:MAG: response regulator transcription factor [Bacteroidota bacterium]